VHFGELNLRCGTISWWSLATRSIRSPWTGYIGSENVRSCKEQRAKCSGRNRSTCTVYESFFKAVRIQLKRRGKHNRVLLGELMRTGMRSGSEDLGPFFQIGLLVVSVVKASAR